MREFFKGWKRKAGCVTLVMACGLTALWMRSVAGKVDQIVSNSPHLGCHFLTSENGAISWSTCRQRVPDYGPFQFSSYRNANSREPELLSPWIWRENGQYLHLANEAIPFQSVSALYLALVIPLTLLSAYLLVSRPRSAKRSE